MDHKKIMLFMCCHSLIEIIPPLLTPIQCGAEINTIIPDTLPDNNGDNISSKNREYCELTAHYYAWKNVKADFYGFCHYRRFFGFNITSKYPYKVYGKPSDSDRLFTYNMKQLVGILSEYSVIAPCPEDMGMTAKDHYCSSKFHYEEDLELFLKILNEKYPHISPYASAYLSQNKQYFCNMLIMDKRRFFEYCEMLFSILEQFDGQKNLHGDFNSDRTDGYLGEIFTGIYFTYISSQGEKIKELPRIDINCTFKKQLFYRLFPPETKRRFAAKRAAKHIRALCYKK